MDWLADQMGGMQDLPLWLLQLLLILIMSILTEVITNMALCAIFLPLFGNMVRVLILVRTEQYSQVRLHPWADLLLRSPRNDSETDG